MPKRDASAGTAAAAAVNTLDNAVRVSLESVVRHSTNTRCPERSVARLDAAQTAEVLVARLPPFAH